MAANDNELAEFFTLMSGTRKSRCIIGDVLDDKQQLKPADRKLLEKALDTKGIEHTAIERWLKARGVQVSGQTVGHHRRKNCYCFKVGAQK